MMNALIPVFLHTLYASLIAGVFIIILMIVKKLLHERISARVFNIIWLLIFLRLLMPFQLPNPLALSGLIPEKLPILNEYTDSRTSITTTYQFGLEPGGDPFTGEAAEKTASEGIPVALLAVLRVFPYIWITGCAGLILLALVLIMRFRKKFNVSQKVIDSDILELAERCSEKLQIKRKVPIFTNSFLKSPAISGVIHQAVYLPEDIKTQVDPVQLRHILLHELAHYKRGDSVINLLSLLAALIHWFNPLVWLAVREMRHDREVSCDALVMEVLGEAHAIPYGMTILDISRLFSRMPGQLSLVSFNETSGQVERRIKMIKGFKSGSYKLTVIAIILCLAVGAAAFTDAFSKKPALDAMITLLSNEQIKNKLVIIDPGHGGDDFGAVYPFVQSDISLIQVKEKDMNLDIALKLYAMLKHSGIKVAMTRTDDRTLTLDERIKIANGSNAALVLTIHNNNQSNDETANGTSTWFFSGKDPASTALTSARLAELLQNEMINKLQTNDLGVKEINTRLLRETSVPSAMVDVAFISNAADREKLMDEGFRDKAALALYDGVIAALIEMTAAQSGK